MRKENSIVWGSLVLFGIICVLSAQGVSLRGKFKVIDMDGSLSDWNGRDMMYPDGQIADGQPPGSTYSMVYVCNDSSNLYVGLELKGISSINSNWTHNLFIDSDMDRETGFHADWMTGGGYDFMIQYGGEGIVFSVFKFVGSDAKAWLWSFLGRIGWMSDLRTIEWAIPLDKIGLREESRCRLEFQVTGPAVEVETWAHKTEAFVSTYTCAGDASKR